MSRLLLIGLEEPEYKAIKARLRQPIVFHPDLPRCKIEDGRLMVEDPNLIQCQSLSRDPGSLP